MAMLPPSPFLFDPDNRFVPDEDRLFVEIVGGSEAEPMPSFLSDPRPEYLKAVEIVSILEILAGHL